MLWNDALRTGNPSIDAQHEELCWLTDELAGAREKGNLAAALRFLLDYTGTHFQNEETIMRDAGFTGLADQQAQHRYFIDTVQDFQARYERQELDFKTMLDFLSSWLVEHIEKEDIPMVRQLSSGDQWA